MRHRTRLTQSIRLIDSNPQPLVHSIHQLPRQRRRPARNHLHTAKIVPIHHLIPRQPHNHRRRNVDECDPMFLDGREERLHIKCRHDDELDAPVQHLMHQSRKPVNVEEGQHAEKLVGG